MPSLGRNNVHTYREGVVLDLVGAKIVEVKRNRAGHTSKDIIVLKHECCGAVREYSVGSLNKKIKRTAMGESRNPKLCQKCAAEKNNTRMRKVKDNYGDSLAMFAWRNPSWPVPKSVDSGSWYSELSWYGVGNF